MCHSWSQTKRITRRLKTAASRLSMQFRSFHIQMASHRECQGLPLHLRHKPGSKVSRTRNRCLRLTATWRLAQSVDTRTGGWLHPQKSVDSPEACKVATKIGTCSTELLEITKSEECTQERSTFCDHELHNGWHRLGTCADGNKRAAASVLPSGEHARFQTKTRKTLII